MLRNTIVAVTMLMLVGCSMFSTKPNLPPKETLTAEETALCLIPSKAELPPPLDLTEYKVANGTYILYNDGKPYIGIPETELNRQHSLILLLKNRIYELQQIIIDTNKLNEVDTQ